MIRLSTSFFLSFLLIFVVPITIVFAEFPSDAAATINEEDNFICDLYTKALDEYPDSRNVLCQYKLHCEGFEATWSDEKATMENDYLVQQFLHKNPGISLDDFEKSMVSTVPNIIGGYGVIVIQMYHLLLSLMHAVTFENINIINQKAIIVPMRYIIHQMISIMKKYRHLRKKDMILPKQSWEDTHRPKYR